MSCEIIKPLLSEFADERLDAATAWQVQTHLAACTACRQVSRDLTQMRRLLQALPPGQPSAQFDAVLAQRLAMTRRLPAPAAPRRTLWQEVFTRLLPQPRLRPALAFGLVVTAGAAAVLFPLHSARPLPAPVSVHAADPVFVADCLAQRRRDAAGEPLADLSAQNLAGHLDNAASESSAPENSAADDTAAQTSDASIF